MQPPRRRLCRQWLPSISLACLFMLSGGALFPPSPALASPTAPAAVNTWLPNNVFVSRPDPRAGAALVRLPSSNRDMLLLGGIGGRLGKDVAIRFVLRADAWIFRHDISGWVRVEAFDTQDTATNTTAADHADESENVSTTDTPPSQAAAAEAQRLARRAFAACAASMHSGRVYCFGGLIPLPGTATPAEGYHLDDMSESAELVEYDDATGKLRGITPHVAGALWPAARVHASLAATGQYLVLVGGARLADTPDSLGVPLDTVDPWAYDVTAGHWLRLVTSGEAPAARFAHTSFIGQSWNSTEAVVVMGGCGGPRLNSCASCGVAFVGVSRAVASGPQAACEAAEAQRASGGDCSAAGPLTTTTTTTGAANASTAAPTTAAEQTTTNASSSGYVKGLRYDEGYALKLIPSAAGNGSEPVPTELHAVWTRLSTKGGVILLAPSSSLLGSQACAPSSIYDSATTCTISSDTSGALMHTVYLRGETAEQAGSLEQTVLIPDQLSSKIPLSGGEALASGGVGTILKVGGFAHLNFLDTASKFSETGRFWQEAGNDAEKALRVLKPGGAVLGDVGFVYGGINSVDMRSSSLTRVDLTTGAVTPMLSHSAGERYGATVTPLGTRALLIFGGLSGSWLDNDLPRCQDNWVYFVPDINAADANVTSETRSTVERTLGTWEIILQRDSSLAPAPRGGHTAVSVASADAVQVVVFGGWKRLRAAEFSSAEVLDDLWVYTVPTGTAENDGTWTQPATKATASTWPPGRAEHAAAALRDATGRPIMVMTGGLLPPDTVDTRIWLLRLDGPLPLAWRVVPVVGVAPSPALFFTATATLSGQQVVAYGGMAKVDGVWEGSERLLIGEFLPDGTAWQWTEVSMAQASPRFGALLLARQEETRLLLGIAGGAALTERSMSTDLPLLYADLACQPGTFALDSFYTCAPCPLGSFSTNSGASRCTPCPGDAYTAATGASASSNCTVCLPGACNGHGSCSILADNTAKCRCYSLYGGDTCERNVALVAAGTIIGLAFVVVAILWLVRRSRKRIRTLHSYSQLQEKLIEESRLELDELKRAWTVDAADVDFLKRIDGGSEGAFGEVWLAAWQGRRVAIKQLRLSVQEFDDTAEADFEAEVAFLRSLRHRNIVFFYGTGVRDGSPFLVTEFLEQGSLRQLLSHARSRHATATGSDPGESSTSRMPSPTGDDIVLPWARRLAFAADVAAGMHFLHTLTPPRIHRDLKGANVLVGADDVCKIADFGTAKLLSHIRGENESRPGGASSRLRGVFTRRKQGKRHDGEADGDVTAAATSSAAAMVGVHGGRDTHTDEATRMMTTDVGTFLWSSPEILLSQPYGLSADVYAFGMVMYELASCAVPFEDVRGPPWRLRSLIAEEQHRPTLPPTTPEAFAALARACWAHSPTARPSFADVVSALASMREATVVE